ncbi:hypothetical protein [Streptomyces sp. NBC_01618]|uniref:hypothetical protein n=1 Tax=Streptomyces sp. NBC_01618 TaxID=2975900 RepID=UPI00386DE68A|nr:hypothetical protein OH735_17160 [Streptomyces sp. NBC_01618]
MSVPSRLPTRGPGLPVTSVNILEASAVMRNGTFSSRKPVGLGRAPSRTSTRVVSAITSSSLIGTPFTATPAE